jgi:hypothetical protein
MPSRLSVGSFWRAETKLCMGSLSVSEYSRPKRRTFTMIGLIPTAMASGAFEIGPDLNGLQQNTAAHIFISNEYVNK